jgi:predicted DNA-binding ribbon-helix-helix protein
VKTSCLVNRNVTALRGRTSMRLEPELWDALEEICAREAMSLTEVVKQIERVGHPGGRTSAVRVHVLAYFRRAATEAGHRLAGHGPHRVPDPAQWDQPKREASDASSPVRAPV